MTEQDEYQQHGYRLKELIALEKERGADAEKVARPDAEHDQRGHGQLAFEQRTPGRHEERPTRVENCGAGEAEQPLVEW